jgi:hypothetical protein
MKILKNGTPKVKDDLYRHAKKRLLERYGVGLTRELYEEMISKIQNHKALHLLKESNYRCHYLVDDQYIAIFDKRRQAISTFLPPEAIIGYLGQR